MGGFNPAQHLREQGWAGEGTGLRPGARSRPIGASKRRDALSGLGKDTENLYDTVASKKRGADGKPRTTATGIISPHDHSASRSTSSPPTTRLNGERDLDAIAAAKTVAVRAALYARFLRGPVLAPEPEPTPDPTPISTSASEAPSPAPEPSTSHQPAAETKGERKERRRLKREAKLAHAATSLVPTPALIEPPHDDDAARRERKRAKRAAKAAAAGLAHATAPSASDAPAPTLEPAQRPKKKRRRS